jgi:hypothetical protein
MRGFLPAAVVVVSIVLGATVFRGEVASAAQQALQVFVTNDSANPVPVKQQGATDVNVLGSVPTHPSIPTTQFSRVLTPGGSTVISGPDPAGTNYAITSISIANPTSTAVDVTVSSFYGPTTDCLFFSGPFSFTFGPSASVPAEDTISLVFPQPFVFTALTAGPGAGAQSCLRATGGTVFVRMTIVGYRF